MIYRLLKTLPLLVVLPVFSLAALCARALQQPAPPVPPQDESSSAGAKPKHQKYSHANDFLLRGTVFNDKALSFPGVELRLKRVGQAKFHWQTVTNSRGEFAVRIPQGFAYELVVHAKGYADQTRAIDAKNGGAEEGYVFRMEPLGGKL
jgi:hypothetical protein